MRNYCVTTIMLFLLASACRSGSSQRKTGTTPSPPQGAKAALSPDELVAKYRLFDPNYNFLRTSSSSFEYAKATFPVLDGSASQISLIKMDELLSTRMDLLNKAQKTVRIQALIFEGDESGWAFADKLVEVKRRGVDVKVIVDAVSNVGISTQRLYFYLEQNGILVEGYDPFYLWPLVYKPNVQGSFLDKVEFINKRFHEKYFIVDGDLPDKAVGITGGVNISNEYFRVDVAGDLQMWRDEDVMMKGQAAVELTKLFDRNFASLVAERKTNGVLDFDGFWGGVQSLAKLFGKSELVDVNRPKFNPDIQRKIAERRVLPVTSAWHAPAKFRVMHNRPRLGEFFLDDAYIDLINSATKNIVFMHAYFVPSDAMLAALRAAVKRGVNIRVVTNSLESSEFELVGIAVRSSYKTFLAINEEEKSPGSGRIDLFEWQGDHVLHNGEGHLHSKVAVFDNEAVAIGSYNLDQRSRYMNSENDAFFIETNIANELVGISDDYIKPEYSKPVTYAQALTFAEPPADFMAKMRLGLVQMIPNFF